MNSADFLTADKKLDVAKLNAWFDENMPGVKAIRRETGGYYINDLPLYLKYQADKAPSSSG